MSSPSSPVGSGTSNGTNSSSASALSTALNITPADFLQLITTQLQDQNPLQPTDPTQFLGQLEQMSEVSSMQSMQTSLTSLQTSLQSTQMANGQAMLGQTVLAPSTTGTLDSSGGSVTGAVSVPSGATSVTVKITNARGAPIHGIEGAGPARGLADFNGKGTT